MFTALIHLLFHTEGELIEELDMAATGLLTDSSSAAPEILVFLQQQKNKYRV